MAVVLCFGNLCFSRNVPFCEKQIQDWSKLGMAACLEKEIEIDEAINTGYKVSNIVIPFS